MNPQAEDRLVYEGRILTLRIKHVELADGRRHMREIVEHAAGAAVVAVDEDGQVLLVRQLRPAVGLAVLELPAGLIDAGEQPVDAARRELEEETGHTADRLEPLVTFYTSPGFTDEVLHIFVGTGLRETARRQDEEEEIDVVRMPLAEAVEHVMHAEISDAKTVTGLLAVLVASRES